jgi:hypothetical protein
MYSTAVCVVHASAGKVVRRYPPDWSDDAIPAAAIRGHLAVGLRVYVVNVRE